MRVFAIVFAAVWFCNAMAMALPVAAAQPIPVATKGCGDFLAQMQKKPAHLTYLGCDFAPDRQGKPMQAHYRVSGRFAAATEDHLIRSFGLSRLQRSCCQWDAPAAQFRDSAGRDFSISMVSEGTAVSHRSQWHRIKTFAVTLEMLTEEI